MSKTDDAYRAFAKRLVKLGVSQKSLGVAANHKSGWASKWLAGNAGALSVDAMDGLDTYFEQLGKLLEHRPRMIRETRDLERKPA